MNKAIYFLLLTTLILFTPSTEGATVQLKNGKSFSGELKELTSDHVVLDMDGVSVTLDRAEVVNIDMTGTGATATAPTPAPASNPAPAAPAQQAITVPANTTLMVSIGKNLGSRTSKSGEPFTGNLTGDVRVNNTVVFPAGSAVEGRVTSASPASRGVRKTPGAINLEITRIILGDKVVPVATALQQEQAERQGGGVVKGAAKGAGKGALFGRFANDDAGDGAAKGAIVGASKGLVSAGEDITITKGSVMAFSLRAPATL